MVLPPLATKRAFPVKRMGLVDCPLVPCMVTLLTPLEVEATLLTMLLILENVAETLRAPALLAVNLAAITPSGLLATYSRLNKRCVSSYYNHQWTHFRRFVKLTYK